MLVLAKIGMIRQVNIIDGIPTGKFETDYNFSESNATHSPY